MMKFVFKYSFVMFILLVSCKKETVQPDPIPGKVIVKSKGLPYSGYIETALTVYHRPGNIMDSSLSSSIYLYDAVPTGSEAISLNGYPFSSSGSSYYLSLYPADISNPFLSEFRSLSYSGTLVGSGNFSLNDNRAIGFFSNHNSIPLNFSKANGYTCTLNNLANCDFIQANIGINQANRSLSIQNPMFKFFDSELLNTSVGSKTSLQISLIAQKDTLINSKKFFIDKKVIHNYELTFTN